MHVKLLCSHFFVGDGPAAALSQEKARLQKKLFYTALAMCACWLSVFVRGMLLMLSVGLT
jgi:hypothetical protein